LKNSKDRHYLLFYKRTAMIQKSVNIFEYKKEPSIHQPLAERCRPRKLEDVVGNSALIGADSPLMRQLKNQYLPSLILWGPPGVGKTTLAHLLAEKINYRYAKISAVSSGVKEVKEIIAEASRQLNYHGKPTALFIDEIHRFNKAQQDALLNAVEEGIITLIGATTENPSFEINAPLLSRCQVLKLGALTKADLSAIIKRAVKTDFFLKEFKFRLNALDRLIHYGNGDARKTLNLLEIAVSLAEKKNNLIVISEKIVKQAAAQNPLYYDKKGDNHYDTISAFIKSIRGSDPDAAVFWLARMLQGGEDPVFIARRLLILASEDVGNAEPYALSLANACFDAVHKIGMPEARIILSQTVTYLASVPKSNAAYLAIKKAESEVREHRNITIPLHLRNAPTKLMKDLDYGTDYKYPHDFPYHYTPQNYFPDGVENRSFYNPTELGREKQLKNYLDYIKSLKKDKK
jgi:putative ATPase